MKRILITLLTATTLFPACNGDGKKNDSIVASNTFNNDSSAKAASGNWVPVDSATAMKSMMEAGTPGDEHAMLAKGDGNWRAEMTMWMAPGASPMVAKSSSINKMILGGRYQQTTYRGDLMGMPFEGVSTTGYDKVKKVYFTTWIDNMSTAMMNMEGTWDDASRSINFKGKMICPANGKECEMREIYKIIDDNTHLMEMYGPDMQTGKEFKNMEIKFVRGK